MKVNSIASSAALLSLLAESDGLSVYTPKDLPQNEWVSAGEDGSAFMAAPHPDLVEHVRKRQDERDLRYSKYVQYTDYFVDGSETFWPEGSQAWRLIGYYIDCYNVEQGYNDRRQLHEGDEDYDSTACLRYLLWGAYIDLEYQGGGIGEYKYWYGPTGQWDTSACQESGSYRCAKMDCHLKESDHFRLLGFFKEPNFAQFYEQLFKHQGHCLWSNSEYEFMQKMRKQWPQGCTFSGTKDSGNNIYFDMRPLDGADVSIGLYTNDRCSRDYTGSKTVLEVVEYYETYGNGEEEEEEEEEGSGSHSRDNDGTLTELVTYMDAWNSGMDLYKQCQPCKAYNLNYKYSSDDQTQQEKSDDYYIKTYGKHWYYYKRYQNMYGDDGDGGKEDQSHDDSKGHFLCYDDAGYINVNQCMKFATHTKAMAASFRDVLTAASQGTINDVYVGKITVHPGAYIVPGTNWRASDFLAIVISTLFFFGSGYMLLNSWRRCSDVSFANNYRAPLVPATSEGALL